MNEFSMVGIAAIVVGILALAFAGIKYAAIQKKIPVMKECRRSQSIFKKEP